jgi:hypothetical protein
MSLFGTFVRKRKVGEVIVLHLLIIMKIIKIIMLRNDEVAWLKRKGD